MPKDEFDPDDPMELHGVVFLTEQDTGETMTECFVEEFLRLGYSAGQVLALFRNPHYTGPNMAYQNRGEAFVKAKIVEVFGWWRCPAVFGIAGAHGGATPSPKAPAQTPGPSCAEPTSGSEPAQSIEQS